ncbi:MAG TPA: LLM class flavin-dependent oxidoreductase [Actinomycetota bacterium]|nr:LLM class flavin-dependent oxidoreductase [Actinomycetota bacterium]
MADDNRLPLAVALNGYGLAAGEPDGVRQEVLAWRDVVDVVETAEETGYRAVFVPEIAAREAFSTLAGFAAATSEIALATGVIRIDRRDLHTTALAAATVADLSGGRFTLGLGSGRPIESTRRFVADVREALRGGDVIAEEPAGGRVVIAGLDHPAPDVPLYLAALGPRMTELAGEVADGVLLNWCTPERVARARAEVGAGAERAARDPGDVAVAVYVRACLGHDEPTALAALREAAARYAAMPKYRRQFEAMGLGEPAAAAAGALAAGRLADAPEALARAVCVWGGRDEALARLAAYRDAGADLVVVYPVPALEAVSSITGTILAAAPDPAVER